MLNRKLPELRVTSQEVTKFLKKIGKMCKIRSLTRLSAYDLPRYKVIKDKVKRYQGRC